MPWKAGSPKTQRPRYGFPQRDLVKLCALHLRWNNTRFNSVQSLSHVHSLQPHGPQHAKTACPSPAPRVYPNWCPLSLRCHPTLSSSVVPFSSCLQSFPASESFPMSQLFASGGQSIGVSASASVLPMNIQNWFPLEWTGWISLQSKWLSRIFFSTTVQKHQFFSAQLSLILDYIYLKAKRVREEVSENLQEGGKNVLECPREAPLTSSPQHPIHQPREWLFKKQIRYHHSPFS